MNVVTGVLLCLIFGALLQGVSCTPAANPDALDSLGFVDLSIGEQKFHLWVADSFAEQANGLMLVSADRMEPLPDGTERGMLFVFEAERQLSFWMKNTIIPLDIAYIDSDGRVVQTYTMLPLDDRPGQYPSVEPARFAIEANAGVYERIGLKVGDQVTIPSTVLKRGP